LDTGATAGARHHITDRLLPRLSTRPIVSHDLKAHHLAHPTWRLWIRAIHAAVTTLNTERKIDLLANREISA